MDDRSNKAKLMDRRRKHKLLTKELEKKLPALYSGENIPLHEKQIVVKFFSPWSNWKWYATEYCPEDRLFFGLVDGFEKEWGNFSLTEFEELDKNGLPLIERDCWFSQCKASDVGWPIPEEK